MQPIGSFEHRRAGLAIVSPALVYMSTWVKSANTAEACAAELYLLHPGLVDFAHLAENSGPVLPPSLRALSLQAGRRRG